MRNLAATLVVLSLLPACSRSPLSREEVVALVGETPVVRKELDDWIRSEVGSEPRSPDAMSALFDRFLAEVALASRAPGPAPLRMRVAGLIERATPATPPTDAEVETYFHAHEAELARPESVVLRQMLFKTSEDANAARKRLLAGEPWDRVSSEVSQAPNAATGGRVGRIVVDRLPAGLSEASRKLATDRPSDPIAGPGGFHLLLVESRAPAHAADLSELREEIRRELGRRRSEETAARLLEQSVATTRIEVTADHLPFPYVGRFRAGGKS